MTDAQAARWFAPPSWRPAGPADPPRPESGRSRCTRRWCRRLRRRPAALRVERFLHRRAATLLRGGSRLPGVAARPRADAPPERAAARFALIRLRFNDVLSQFDLFTEVVTQRSEHRTGVVAVRAGRAGRRRPPVAPLVPDPPPADLLPGPRSGRGDPPGADPAARRRPQPGRDHPHPPGADGRPRHRLLAGPRGRAPGRRPPRPGRDPAQGPRGRAEAAGARDAGRWRSLGALDLRDRRRPVVRRDARDRLDARADRRRQPAPVLRVPTLGRRPAPDPVRPGPAELRHRRGALPPPAVGEHARHVEVAEPRRHPAAGTPGGVRGPGSRHPCLRRRAPHPPLPQPRRPLAPRGVPHRRADPHPVAAAAHVVARRHRRHGSATTDLVFAVAGQARAAGRITPEAESQLIGTLLRAWALRSTLASAEQITTTRRVLARAS